MRAQHIEGHSLECGDNRETDLIIGLRQLAPPDRDVHGVPPAELMPPLEGVRPPQAGPGCVHHHLPACLPLHCLHSRAQNRSAAFAGPWVSCKRVASAPRLRKRSAAFAGPWVSCKQVASAPITSCTITSFLRRQIPLFQPLACVLRYLDSGIHCLMLAFASITLH